MYNIKKKNARFGRYPSCDMVNNAIRDIISGNYDVAIDELYFAIQKSEGYLHEDIAEKVEQIHKSVAEKRMNNLTS